MAATAYDVTARFLPWIFALCSVTACSDFNGTSTTTEPKETSTLGCPKGPAPARNSILVESPSAGLAIARSQRKATARDDLKCCQAKESRSGDECR